MEEHVMRSLLLSTVAVAALAVGTVTVSAQTTDTRRLEPGMQGQTQGSSGSAQDEQKKGSQQSPRVVGPGQSQAPGSAQSDQKSEATQDQQKGSAQTDRAPSTGGKDRDLGTKQTQDQLPKAKDQAPSQQRATGAQQREPRGQVQDQRTPQAKQPGAAQKRDELSGQPKGQAKTQQPGRFDTQSETQARSGEAGATKLSDRQHTTIQQSFQRERNLNLVSRSDFNISVSIGATIPRSVRLAPLPASIVAVVPQFRGFQYVVVEDEIVIIHPRTYRIVEVIPLEGRGSARVAIGGRSSDRVQLSSAQRARILSYAASDCTTVLTQTDFDLAVGATIPQQIELCPFEGAVVNEVSVLRPYRFFLVRDQVVLVDPTDHTIVEVIR
jgi:hypothetical protein